MAASVKQMLPFLYLSILILRMTDKGGHRKYHERRRAIADSSRRV